MGCGCSRALAAGAAVHTPHSVNSPVQGKAARLTVSTSGAAEGGRGGGGGGDDLSDARERRGLVEFYAYAWLTLVVAQHAAQACGRVATST